jgi:hypothetical protein
MLSTIVLKPKDIKIAKIACTTPSCAGSSGQIERAGCCGKSLTSPSLVFYIDRYHIELSKSSSKWRSSAAPRDCDCVITEFSKDNGHSFDETIAAVAISRAEQPFYRSGGLLSRRSRFFA